MFWNGFIIGGVIFGTIGVILMGIIIGGNRNDQ